MGKQKERMPQVIMGQSYQNGECANGARMALLEAGWPNRISGITLDLRDTGGIALCSSLPRAPQKCSAW
jgi:acetyl-CoA acetyltransferase